MSKRKATKVKDDEYLLILPVKLTEEQGKQLLIAQDVMTHLCNTLLLELEVPVTIDTVRDNLHSWASQDADITTDYAKDSIRFGTELYKAIVGWLLDEETQKHMLKVRKVTG